MKTKIITFSCSAINCIKMKFHLIFFMVITFVHKCISNARLKKTYPSNKAVIYTQNKTLILMLTFFNEIFLSFRFARFFFEVWQKVFVSNVNVPKRCVRKEKFLPSIFLPFCTILYKLNSLKLFVQLLKHNQLKCV